ncbi:hypothetical protein E2C01_077363 [Portunus trituberculatus]|uniref:Uncharacterized protein n=1 Tax=Portunus trituberculatus TaxID=210409 RepID=A0A5B7IK42_PORTR|nr:hypothetical protein [Portunus trituberculatus]
MLSLAPHSLFNQALQKAFSAQFHLLILILLILAPFLFLLPPTIFRHFNIPPDRKTRTPNQSPHSRSQRGVGRASGIQDKYQSEEREMDGSICLADPSILPRPSSRACLTSGSRLLDLWANILISR